MPHPIIENLSFIHTTPLGIKRISKNLSLPPDEDALHYCKTQIIKVLQILQRGKNYYAYTANQVFIIHAKSYTIITAHVVK